MKMANSQRYFIVEFKYDIISYARYDDKIES